PGKEILSRCLRCLCQTKNGLEGETDKQERPEHGGHRLPHSTTESTGPPPLLVTAELHLILRKGSPGIRGCPRGLDQCARRRAAGALAGGSPSLRVIIGGLAV